MALMSIFLFVCVSCVMFLKFMYVMCLLCIVKILFGCGLLWNNLNFNNCFSSFTTFILMNFSTSMSASTMFCGFVY